MMMDGLGDDLSSPILQAQGSLPANSNNNILKILRAALYIRGAWLGEMEEDEIIQFGIKAEKLSEEAIWSQRARVLVHGRSWLVRGLAGLAWCLAAISLLERPWWCAGGAKCGGDTYSDYYPNSRISGRIAIPFIFTLRTVIWFLAFFENVLSYLLSFTLQRASTTRWKTSRRVKLRTIVLSLLAIDGISARILARLKNWPMDRSATLTPFTCFFRALLIYNTDISVRSQLKLVTRGAPELGALLVLLGLCLAAFAWFGTLLWRDNTAQGHAVFNNYENSLWNLLIALTTANFPDVMQRAYASSRISVIFFLAFMVIGLYLLLNLFLAIVADAYAHSLAERRCSASLIRRSYLRKSFHLLISSQSPDHQAEEEEEEEEKLVSAQQDSSGVLQDTFLLLIDELRQLPSTPSLDQTEARILFAILDDDGQGIIDLAAFESRLMDALRLRFAKVRNQQQYEKMSASRRTLTSIVLSKKFEVVVTIIILANLIFEAIVERKVLAGNDDDQETKRTDGQPDTVSQIAATCFTAFYTIEIICKAIARGGILFLCQHSSADCFDVISTATALIATVVVFYPNSFNNANAIRYALLLRTLRLIRFVTILPAFRRTTDSLSVVLPRAFELLKTITFIGFVFAALGLVLFGGRITTDPNNKHSQQILRRAPDFATAADVGYYTNSMNDVGSAMITLFELMIVNNWFVIASGYIATTSKIHRIYFVFYWIIQVLCFVNLLVATILDTFISEWDSIPHDHPQNQEQQNSTLRRPQSFDEDGQVTFDASCITGTDTGLPHDVYSVVLDQSSSALNEDHLNRVRRRSLLRLLLTPNSAQRKHALPPSLLHRGDDE